MISMGGRIPTTSNDDRGVGVTLTGGRLARRIDDRHAALTCGECHYTDVIEPVDGEPISHADLVDALTQWDHDCETPSD